MDIPNPLVSARVKPIQTDLGVYCIFKQRATTKELLLPESPHCDKSLHLSCFKQLIVKDD
jgi:hypothetical protein